MTENRTNTEVNCIMYNQNLLMQVAVGLGGGCITGSLSDWLSVT